MRSRRELVAADDPQVGRVRFCLQDRRLPLPRQVLEGLGVEELLVELATLNGLGCATRPNPPVGLGAVLG
jgi:hypothetical protein